MISSWKTAGRGVAIAIVATAFLAEWAAPITECIPREALGRYQYTAADLVGWFIVGYCACEAIRFWAYPLVEKLLARLDNLG